MSDYSYSEYPSYSESYFEDERDRRSRSRRSRRNSRKSSRRRRKDKKSRRRDSDSDMSSNDFAVSDDFREFSGRFSGMQSSRTRSRSDSESHGVNPFKNEVAEGGKNRRLRYATAAMQGVRPTMEDAVSVQLDMTVQSGTVSYFGVYDGHGGHTVSDLLETEVPERLKKTIKTPSTKNVTRGIHEAFMAIDADLIADEWNLGDVVGSTALVMIVTEDHVIVGSTGDSRAVLIKENGDVIAMTRDHKPTDKDEAKRIQKAGLTIEKDPQQPTVYRIGGLAMSRALGDTRLKKNPRLAQDQQAVIATPDIAVERNKKIRFAVVACDGIWDVMSPSDVGAFVSRLHDEGKALKKIGRKLLIECLRRKSTDNMSAIIVMWRDKADRKQARQRQRNDSSGGDKSSSTGRRRR